MYPKIIFVYIICMNIVLNSAPWAKNTCSYNFILQFVHVHVYIQLKDMNSRVSVKNSSNKCCKMTDTCSMTGLPRGQRRW